MHKLYNNGGGQVYGKRPHIETRGNRKVLMVHNSPFIMLAGEVHNSNASSAVYMEQV